MPLTDTDKLIISRSGQNYQMEASELKEYSGANVIISPTPPPGASVATLWWDSIGGRMYVRYNDGSSIQWVETSPAGVDLSNYYTKDEVDARSVVSASASGDSGSITWEAPGGGRFCQQWGKVTHNGSGIGTVIFPVPYNGATVPNLTLTPSRLVTTNCIVSIISLSNTSFQASAALAGGGAAATTSRWSAIGLINS